MPLPVRVGRRRYCENVASQETGPVGLFYVRSSEGEGGHMSFLKHYRSRFYCFLLLSLCFIAPGIPLPASGQSRQGIIRGRVLDPLGDAVPHAKATLLQNSTVVESQTTDPEGEFEFSAVNSGRYYVRVEATGFQTGESETAFLPPRGPSKSI